MERKSNNIDAEVVVLSNRTNLAALIVNKLNLLHKWPSAAIAVRALLQVISSREAALSTTPTTEMASSSQCVSCSEEVIGTMSMLVVARNNVMASASLGYL